MSILWANEAAEHLISSYQWLVSEKKTEAVNAYLIKNSGKGERGVGGNGGGGAGGGGGGCWGSGVGRQSKGLGGVVWVYKIGLKWPVPLPPTSIPPSPLLRVPNYKPYGFCGRLMKHHVYLPVKLLQWQSLENLSLSLCLKETENWPLELTGIVV